MENKASAGQEVRTSPETRLAEISVILQKVVEILYDSNGNLDFHEYDQVMALLRRAIGLC